MTIAVSGKIQASDYNIVYNKMNAVMGQNTDGYGQADLSSSSQSANADISVAVWNNLRADLIRARYHQTGVDPSGSLDTISSAAKITYAVWNQADVFADTITTNKRSVASNQGTVEAPAGGTSTRSTNWSVSLVHAVTIDFSSANNARYFFNAGGEIRIRAYRSGTAAHTKDTAWSNMLGNNSTLNGQGTMYMNHTLTDTLAGTFDTSPSDQRGTGSAIGFYDLTTTNQQIYIKNGPSGNYAENYYRIQARVNASPNPTQVLLTINFVDADIGDDTTPFDPWPNRVDESVTGTTASLVTIFRPSGSNVSVTGPTITSTFTGS